jgi:2,4-dienoyl-CoA reductase-like NADH-dependent reductase (Old Yellow Enzyme family)
MVTYYSQRASAGLIISEATGISQQGLGWPYAPGLWSDEQVAAWKPVTDAVHAAGGRIIAQLWHMGRIVHPSFNNNQQPVSASATKAPGKAHTYIGRVEYTVARPLQKEEIANIVKDYANAAKNAIKAGFDGVQIHAANGYLIDQFLRDGTNLRNDEYGGSIQNRIRLLVEVTQAVIDAVGADRTSVRLSPNGNAQGTNDSNPHELFPAAAKALSDLNIAFLELREPDFDGTFGRAEVAPVAPLIRKQFNGVLVLNSDYDYDKAQAPLNSGLADAITFGRTFLANPDLPYRFAKGLPLNQDNFKTWYTQTGEGYIDYPYATPQSKL